MSMNRKIKTVMAVFLALPFMPGLKAEDSLSFSDDDLTESTTVDQTAEEPATEDSLSFTDDDLVDYKTIAPLTGETRAEKNSRTESRPNRNSSSNNARAANRPNARILASKRIRHDTKITTRLSKPEMNRPFPELTGTTFYGERLRIRDYRGKLVLVDFWASWCGPCRRTKPELKRLYNKYNKDGFEIVGISMDNSGEDLRAYLGTESGYLPWPSFFYGDEEGSRFWKEMGISGIPTTFLVDQSGKVVAINPRGAALENKIQQHLNL